MESKAGAVAAVVVENLPGWGSFQVTAARPHPPARPQDLAAASPQGSTRWRGGPGNPGLVMLSLGLSSLFVKWG